MVHNEAKAGPFHVHFDPRDQVIAKRLVLYGSFEEQEIKLLCSFCKPGDCVMDIGSNIGIYSLNLSRAVGPEGRVIAVEPDPDNLRLLQKNLEINSCHNVVVVPCGLGEDSGSAELYQPEENRGALSLVDVRGTGKSVRVPIRRAKDVLAELKMTPIVEKLIQKALSRVSSLDLEKPCRKFSFLNLILHLFLYTAMIHLVILQVLSVRDTQ